MTLDYVYNLTDFIVISDCLFFQDDIRTILPRELIELIVQAIDLRTKRALRLASKNWWNFIRLDEFTIYFASQSTIPQIAQHFGQFYAGQPIGLTFEKILEGRIESFPVHHFATLTHLTSLLFNFRRGVLKKTESCTSLTTLTNLLTLSSSGLHGSFTNLTSLEVSDIPGRASLPLYPNLRDLTINSRNEILDPFTLVGNPSRLTSMTVRIGYVQLAKNSDNIVTKFSNLKSLHLRGNARQAQTPHFLQHLTSLERLWTTFGTFEGDIYVLTRLTRLTLQRRPLTATNETFEKLSELCNLKSLNSEIFTNDEDYSFLRRLTALECMATFAESMTGEGLTNLNSQKFTQLRLRNTGEHFNVDYLSDLTTLEILKITEGQQNQTPKSYDGLKCLYRLHSLALRIITSDLGRFTVLDSLTGLTKLRFKPSLSWEENGIFNYRILTNLEKLTVSNLSTMAEDIRFLTRLTSLRTSNLSPDIVDLNFTALATLPLRKLVVIGHTPRQIYDLVTKLTDLEFLEFTVHMEEVIGSLSVLTKLTCLAIARSNLQGVHLTKLTNLQMLRFQSQLALPTLNSTNLSEKLPRLFFKGFRGRYIERSLMFPK